MVNWKENNYDSPIMKFKDNNINPNNFLLTQDELKEYFKLEKPIGGGSGAFNNVEIYQDQDTQKKTAFRISKNPLIFATKEQSKSDKKKYEIKDLQFPYQDLAAKFKSNDITTLNQDKTFFDKTRDMWKKASKYKLCPKIDFFGYVYKEKPNNLLEIYTVMISEAYDNEIFKFLAKRNEIIEDQDKEIEKLLKEKLKRMDDIGITCYDIKPENAVLKTKKKEDGTEIIEDVRLIDWDGDFCLKKNYINKDKDNNKIKGNRLFNLLLMANHFYDIKHSFGIKHNIFINSNQEDLTLTQEDLVKLRNDKKEYCSNFYYINRIKQYFRDLPKSDNILDYCNGDVSTVFDTMITRLECNIELKPETKPKTQTESCPKPPSNLNPFAKRPTKPERPKKSYEKLQNTGNVQKMLQLFQGGNKTKSKRNKKNKTNKKRQTFDVYCK